ncbi:hypothetical protein [Streptomyces sp. ISL-100]|uniref:hypothetical protein n=1 Tax=Streptomyces sp. ISL-100 TaxID=2819173 RepID=UPI001BE82F7E|nr:hypothetical protein [Streptomyces sp. ISL-100]MBT2396003.1 hypothetical protein [Streptomyces sp. ISL-100]
MISVSTALRCFDCIDMTDVNHTYWANALMYVRQARTVHGPLIPHRGIATHGHEFRATINNLLNDTTDGHTTMTTAVRTLLAAEPCPVTGADLLHPQWQRESDDEIAGLMRLFQKDWRARLALWNPNATSDRDALLWLYDGNAYSASGLLVRIAEEADVDCVGRRDGSFDSAHYWHTAGNVSLAALAARISA